MVRELDRLLGKLPHQRPAVEHVSQGIAGPAPSRVLSTLERALIRRRQVMLRYRAASRAGRLGSYQVDPLRLRLVNGDLYLCAYVLERAAARTFKVVRIIEAKLLNVPSQPHPEWTDERLFRGAVKVWGGELVDVVIRLSSSVAHLAHEYPLVDGQQIDDAPDGSVLVRARVAGLVEVSRWVLSWGSAAEAISPSALRQALREDLEASLQPYRPKPCRRTRS